jgi:hypothetical protein
MVIYWNIGQILMDLINWLLNPKMHAKIFFFCFRMKILNDMIFLYFWEIWLYAKHKKNSFFICRFLEIKLPLKVKRSFPSTSLNPKKKKTKQNIKAKSDFLFYFLFSLSFLLYLLFIIFILVGSAQMGWTGQTDPTRLIRLD